ncbi:MAG: amidinotransferase [Verrucomicrobia bacterium]|nr:MAG: amidinotransferase [Verrucomicrobiota bacterium]
MRKVLLCPPDYYGIEYEINPWMNLEHNADPKLAQAQWLGLHDKLKSLGCTVEVMAPQPKLPDMVFTANAGLVVGRQFIRSNFHFPQRQGEEQYFDKWFEANGYKIVRLPAGLFFEGEGDALFCGETLFCGYRFRSDIRSHERIGEILKCLVISLELVLDRHYHLDTCFCPLPDGGAIWYPAAFDTYGQRAIRHRVKNLIDATPEEAGRFACNAVVLERDVLLPEGCPELSKALSAHGYRPHALAMGEYLKAGGACKCLTLLLPQRPDL